MIARDRPASAPLLPVLFGQAGNVRVGQSASVAAKVTGSLPEGLTRPKRMLAMAWPPPMPGYQDSRMRFDVGRPGHADRAAVLQHHDGVGIGGGDGGDQRVLLVGKAEGRGVLALGHPLRDEDDGELGGCGGFGGCGGIRAGIVGDAGAGRGLLADVAERGRREVDGLAPDGRRQFGVDGIAAG